MSGSSQMEIIGIVGTINLSILFLITVWRTCVYQWSALSKDGGSYFMAKKICFFACLMLSTACDIPMYIGFILTGQYVLPLYAFHKFECAFLFAAYSITISDWIGVLYDIREDVFRYFQIRRATLIAINVVFITISLVNFVYCFIVNDLSVYLSSWVYILGLLIQIVATFIVNLLMMSAGLKLAHRIQGATGLATSYYGRFSSPIMKRSFVTSQGSVGHEFSSALRCLNIVMVTCTFCITFQIILLILNYSLGYANKTGKFVGPFYFYWFFYSWLPLWGPVLSLLYLTRANSAKKKVTSKNMTMSEQDEQRSERFDSASTNGPFVYTAVLGHSNDRKSVDVYEHLLVEDEDHIHHHSNPNPHHLLSTSSEPYSPDNSLYANSHIMPSEIYYRDIQGIASPQYHVDYIYHGDTSMYSRDSTGA